MENFFEENRFRFVLFPIEYDDIWLLYKKAIASFGTAEEINLSQDFVDWSALNNNERHFSKVRWYYLLLRTASWTNTWQSASTVKSK